MKMRILRIISFLASALFILVLATTAMATQRSATVNNPNPTDRLNLRTEPRENAPSLGKYYSGVQVELLKEAKNGWIKVRIYNLEGYMKTDFLVQDGDGRSVEPAMPSVKINNSGGTGLYLRETQSTKSPSLGLYKNGLKVRVLGVSETWCHVKTSDGKVGFMLRDMLSPVLEYQKGSGNTANNDGSSSIGSWGGPVGKHDVAAWSIKINDYTGAVNNPNPSDRLHLRTEPKESAESLGKYYNGVRVIINGVSEGEWTKVAIGNLHGFMKTEFLAIGEPAQSNVISAMPIMVVSNPGSAANLNLREGPFATSKSLGIYANGTKVILMGFSDKWAHVIVAGKMGFMQATFLK